MFDPETQAVQRKQHQRRGFTRERDAERALRDLESAVADKRHVDRRDETRGGSLLSWLRGLTVRDTTAASYEQQVRLRIIPHLGGLRLQDVDAEDLDKLYRHLERADSVSDGPLAPTSVHAVLSRALGDAARPAVGRRGPRARDADRAPTGSVAKMLLRRRS